MEGLICFMLFQVYLTLLCAMLSFTFGYYLHLFWEEVGPFTVLSSVASLLGLYFTLPMAMRVLLLLCVPYLTSESIPWLLSSLVFSFLAGSIMGTGILWFGSLLSRERREIYMACLVHSYALMYSSFMLNALEVLDSHTAHWVLEVITVQALFLGYLVVYSQEMLYDAGFGEINFVDRTLTVFFHLPAIVVHAARLY
ncbi:hypothetical protein H5410_012277 [Solanum commersonii]|uniref:Uncharacterized protein n=1 Tax=Solanum commersonii TaxID=4109 RepID=A0A9J6ARY4_SOLCO|nr:hypothetical protein H5410_012277 [Solanum commersonii]